MTDRAMEREFKKNEFALTPEEEKRLYFNCLDGRDRRRARREYERKLKKGKRGSNYTPPKKKRECR